MSHETLSEVLENRRKLMAMRAGGTIEYSSIERLADRHWNIPKTVVGIAATTKPELQTQRPKRLILD